VDRSDKILLFVLVVALVAGLFLAAERAGIEHSNRTVEIIIDAADARRVATAGGVSLVDLLVELREAGAGALAVREMTVGDLAASGRLLIMSAPGRTNLVSPDAELAGVLAPALAARLPHAGIEVAGPTPVLSIDTEMAQLADVPVLLDMDSMRAARAAGMRTVGRLTNFPTVSPGAIDAAAAEANAVGARLVVFDKEEVLGYDELLDETADAFRRHDLLYGFVEMAGQLGDGGLARRLAPRLIRVHSISESDMLTMTPAVAVPRYLRAVRERNIRACYIRLPKRAQRDPVGGSVRYVGALAGSLPAQGFRIGPPTPFTAPQDWPPTWLRAIVALGLPAAFVLLLRRFLPMSPLSSSAAFFLTTAFGLALALLRPGLVVPLGGLAAACLLPALGITWVLQAALGERHPAGAAQLLGSALAGLVAASAISAIGAVLILGLYSRVGYLAGVGGFAGVKLSYLLPLILIAAAAVTGVTGRAEPLARWWQRSRLRAGDFLAQRVTVLQALVILGALTALAFALMRSGNQPPLSPSGLELKARSLLESLLVIRPRTKEFLVGHPALMLAIALALKGRRTWLPLFAVAAGLGQVSLVNTFCHFHTPLHVSVLRTGHGLWIGAALGLVAVLVWRLLFDRTPRLPAP